MSLKIETHGDITRIDQNARRSRAVAGGGILCTAGQVADSLGADITTQAREVFAKIDQLLVEAGTDKTRVLSIQIWLTDLADYDAFNAVWDAWIVPGQSPARHCAKVELANPGYRVELIATACLP